MPQVAPTVPILYINPPAKPTLLSSNTKPTKTLPPKILPTTFQDSLLYTTTSKTSWFQTLLDSCFLGSLFSCFLDSFKNSMAGLQYYFFPTDYLYPRQQSVRSDTQQNAALPLQIQKRDGGDDHKQFPTSLVLHNNKNINMPSAIKKTRTKQLD